MLSFIWFFKKIIIVNSKLTIQKNNAMVSDRKYFAFTMKVYPCPSVKWKKIYVNVSFFQR